MEPKIKFSSRKEREVSEVYFRLYTPAYGEKRALCRIGKPETRAHMTVWIGWEVYYTELAEIPETLHGPYKILDIREVKLPGMKTETLVWLDRFDFLTPVNPMRLYAATYIERFKKNVFLQNKTNK